MKQKIVVKVQMTGNKCRAKAMKIAVVADGVTSVAIEGAEKDQVVVIGDRVDSVSLTSTLRKKVGHAILVSVEEVKEKAEPAKEVNPIQWASSYYHYPPFPMYETVYNDPNPANNFWNLII